jgi:hypothetical protein
MRAQTKHKIKQIKSDDASLTIALTNFSRSNCYGWGALLALEIAMADEKRRLCCFLLWGWKFCGMNGQFFTYVISTV